MIEPLFNPDHFPWLTKLVSNARESIYHFALFGMTTQQLVNTKAVLTAVTIGVLSAMAASYIAAERNAVRLDATIQGIERDRLENRSYQQQVLSLLNQRDSRIDVLTEKQMKLEAEFQALINHYNIVDNKLILKK